MTSHLSSATARACSNIAFIKYWGNINHELRLPANSSISMNLHDLYTTTTVEWNSALQQDEIMINGQISTDDASKRVIKHLDLIRRRLDISMSAGVQSENNFPMGAGIASSASAFAALTYAAIKASGMELSERELSSIARCGSGSASRSIPSGFVEWYQGDSHETSFAETFVDDDYWDIVDVIAIVSKKHKKTGSTAGHQTADTSILQPTRVQDAEKRLKHVKQAITDRNFEQFALIVEEDSNLMHSVMMTSRPALFYWEPLSLEVIRSIPQWREDGLQVCYTMDAGPNVHCICVRNDMERVIKQLENLSDAIEIRVSSAGKGASLLETPI